ncbi:LppA family lipoprotein [Mycoplasma feriruminatoris]|uniref:LppA family lipoprotein n=1 Tax=Mycoplasma feriruminatoris TaxID=1179777 RepID=UPI00241F2A14|nr:LppA family lipoprotein [Mycoplasma feriruminatoris]WFQ90424.1 hypothetical protein MFERI11561_00678 [Mycoplasma feriruminatoris]
MRKFSKLILAILPVSSLTVFSVVSCSTNDKKPTETPKTPDNKIPENQPKKPEHAPESDEKHNSDKSSEEVKPDGEPSPGRPDEQPSPSQPENKPHNPETQPREPENNNNSNEHPNEERPQGDDPQGDEAPRNDVDFSDLNSIPQEISLDHFPKYKKMTPISAWFDLRTNSNVFKDIIFKDFSTITNKYQIKFDSIIDVHYDSTKGAITNVKISFTKDSKSKTKEFTLTGFKKEAKIDNKNKKEDYIMQKDKIDTKLSGLYPSLLAYMLLYNEENGTNNIYDRDLKQSGNVINFDELRNNNQDLFDYNFAGFSVGTKELLFDYNTNDGKLYKDKIVEAKFDDVNGTLGLKVEITNRDDNHSSESTITKEFNFKGFRKIDIKNYRNNPFSFTLTPKGVSEILKNDKIKKSLSDAGIDIHKNEVDEFGGFNSENNIWETLIFKNLLVDLTDNEHHTYRSKKTLGVDPAGSNKEYKSILGLKSNMSLYPFNTIITSESIKNILITIENKQFTLEFELHLPVYATSFSNLLSHAGSDKTLIVRVSQTTKID